MSTERDPIEYMLNALEDAASKPHPHQYGYGEKRRALLAELTRLRAEVEALRADAEAFRASVKLRISVAHHSNRCTAHAEGMAINGVCEQFYKDDPYAATRAAIDAARAALSQETPK